MHQRTKSFAPLTMDGDRRCKLGDEVVWLSERLARSCDLTLSDVQGELALRGIKVGYSSVWRTVHRLGLRFKKTIYASEQERLDVALLRQLWAANQADMNFQSLVFVNETGTTSMVRTRGVGPEGQEVTGQSAAQSAAQSDSEVAG
jgi:hypothetical protein